MVAGSLAALALLIAAGYALRLHEPLPLDRAAMTSRMVLDREGNLLRAFVAEDGRWRLDIEPDAVSQHYLDILLAFEDKRFYDHPGVDPLAFLRAAWQSLRHGDIVSGASTITMQVARLLRGAPTRSLSAKIQQVVDAFRLEWVLTKREILALYLKLAPFGGNLEGVRAASLAYFGKEPVRLNIAEAATLVAIPQSPEVRRPDRNPDAVRQARNRVLERALDAGVIGKADAVWASAQEVPHVRHDFPMFAAHLGARLAAANPGNGVIRTTLNRTLQESAEAITRRHVEALGRKLSVAALILDHRNGEVLAHVGSPGYLDAERLGAIDMTAAVRSPGSALKPFIYGLAFENGLAHPETLIEDRPARFEDYAPSNFDRTWRGTVSIREALQLSLNVPAVKVLAEVGPARLAARFRDAGLSVEMPRNLTVALGGTGLTLEELAALYTALPRGGTPVRLRYLAEENGCGKTSTASASAREVGQLLQPVSAWYVLDILKDTPPPPHASGGGIAFKTGTSYGYRDAWAVGFDGAHLVAVWVGRADATSVPGLMGLQAAAPIVFELFAALSPRRVPLPSSPEGAIHASSASGLPPPLRRFHENAGHPVASASASPAQQPLRISFPPRGAEIEIASQPVTGDGIALPLKAEGGTLPLTWLVNGRPLPSRAHRREAIWTASGPGFVQVTVVDADGRSDRSEVRLR